MKKSAIIFAILAMFGLLFSACSNTSTEKKAKENERDVGSEEGMGMGESESLNTDYPSCPENTVIAEATVSSWVSSFDSLVSANGGHSFVKGFHVCRGDARGILKAANDTAEIVAMIAYDASLDNFDLIFGVPGNNGDYVYYDFVQPCPDYCPNGDGAQPSETPIVSDLGGTKGYWFSKNGLKKVLDDTNKENQTFLMLKQEGSNWSSGIYLIDCHLACNYEESGYFAPCEGDNPCLSFD